LPIGSPNPGKWRTERAEYQRAIMDAFNDPAVERIVVMTSSQVGKTELLNNQHPNTKKIYENFNITFAQNTNQQRFYPKMLF